MVVGLLGGNKSGKDEFGKEFINNGYKRYAFGDIMKKEFAISKNYKIEDMFNHNKDFYRQGMIKYAEDINSKNKFHWVDLIKKDIIDDVKSNKNIIITDIRRVSHLVFFKNLKSLTSDIKLFHIKRPLNNGGVFDNDTETCLAIQYADFHNLIDKVIINDNDAYFLHEKALKEL